MKRAIHDVEVNDQSKPPAKRLRLVSNPTQVPKPDLGSDMSWLDKIEAETEVAEATASKSSFFDNYSSKSATIESTNTLPVEHEQLDIVMKEADSSVGLSPQQLELSRKVDQVVGSDLVLDLQKGFMDPSRAKKCRKIMGYSPPDLQNPSIQKYMIQQGRYPYLKVAFENQMLKAFLTGMNRATKTISNTLMLAQISRSLIEHCIIQTGAESNVREKLLTITSNIREQVDTLADRVNEFVVAMADTNKKIGEVAYLLKYGADVNTLVEELKEVNLSVSNRIAEMDAQANKALAPLSVGVDYVGARISTDGALNKQKNVVEKLRNEYEMAREQRVKLEDAQEINLRNASLCVENARGSLKLLDRQLRSRKKELKRLRERVVEYDNRITKFEKMREKVAEKRDDAGDDLNNLGREHQELVKQEIKSQQKSLDVQISRLEALARQHAEDESKFRSQSLVASDGREERTTTTTYEYHHWKWRWWNDEPRKETTTSTKHTGKGGNEKKRLEEMATCAAGERKEVESELGRLRAERSEIISRVRMQLSASNSVAAARQKRETRARFGDRIADIQEQIIFVEGLKAAVVEQISNAENMINRLEAEKGTLDSQYETAKRAVKTLENKETQSNLNIQHAKREVQERYEEWQCEQVNLKKMIQDFGIREGEDFSSFMKVFKFLNTCLSGLMPAMKLLSQSFAAAYTGFNSDFFKGGISKIPDEASKRQCLLDATHGLQAIAMVGTDFLDAPLQNMLAHQTKNVLNLICETAPGQIEDSVRSSVRIEAVEDEE